MPGSGDCNVDSEVLPGKLMEECDVVGVRALSSLPPPPPPPLRLGMLMERYPPAPPPPLPPPPTPPGSGISGARADGKEDILTMESTALPRRVFESVEPVARLNICGMRTLDMLKLEVLVPPSGGCKDWYVSNSERRELNALRYSERDEALGSRMAGMDRPSIR